MGVDIVYFTKSDLSLEDVRAITAAAREPDNQPWLLCEPISFLDMPGYENRLFGASKLKLIPAPEDKADAENNDLESLLDKLCDLSERFHVDWTIQIEEGEIGSIVNGVCDPGVREAVEAMAGIAEELGEYGDFM
jgi:hypothetical protein